MVLRRLASGRLDWSFRHVQLAMMRAWEGSSMDSKSGGLYLGPASGWSTEAGAVRRSDETAHTFPIRDMDNKHIGDVTRHGRDKWTFKIFSRKSLPVSLYDSKEEALAGASAVR